MSNFNDVINFIKNQYPSKDFISLHEPKFTGKEKEW